MVSKVAVIALVAIVAIPIFLGYAFNLNETTETDYQAAENSVNITPLLQNGIAYSYAHGDIFQLNSNFGIGVNGKIMPYYNKITASKTTLPIYNRTNYTTGQYLNETNTYSSWIFMYYQADYNYSDSAQVTFTSLKPDNTTDYTIGKVHTWLWEQKTGAVRISYYTSSGISLTTYTPAATNYKYNLTVTGGGYTGSGYMEREISGTASYFIDLADGFYFRGNISNWQINLPQYSRSAIYTMDLNSITDPTYSIRLTGPGAGYTLEKSTTGGEVSWLLREISNPARTIDLYYDQTRSSNTYQVYWDLVKTGEDSNYVYYSSHREFRYIGDWTSIIGEANAYITYTDDQNTRISAGNEINYNYLSFDSSSNDRSPKLRVDDAYFRAFHYVSIDNQTFTPAEYKTNPATTLGNVTLPGSSMEFGGNLYTVTDGNIMIGSHKIPVNNMVLDSIPSSTGAGYDNRINGTVISTTPTPSKITLTGQWATSVSIQSMQQYTYTKTEWVAGEFGWDGVDHNFLIVGLIVCLGVFIGCGIYARRSGVKSIIPVMIVCGGAALMFFLML